MEKKKYTNLERLFDACGSAYESHLSPAFMHVFVAAIGFFSLAFRYRSTFSFTKIQKGKCLLPHGLANMGTIKVRKWYRAMTGPTCHATLLNQWEGALVFINKQIKTSPQWSKQRTESDRIKEELTVSHLFWRKIIYLTLGFKSLNPATKV